MACNYTSIEQSKKLLELGLKPETADMHYELVGREYKFFPTESVAIKQNLFSFRNGYTIPCWSINELIKIMPSPIKNPNVKNNPEVGMVYADYFLTISKDAEGKFLSDEYCFQYMDEDACGLVFTEGQTPMEACMGIMEWLLKNKYL